MPRRLPRQHPSPPARVRKRASLRAKDYRPTRGHSFAARAFILHPGVSWSTLAAIAAVLTFASPYISSLVGLVETTSKAEARERAIRADIDAAKTEFSSKMDLAKADSKTDVAGIYVEVGKIKAEVKAHEDFDNRQSAGVNQTLLESRTTTARNRVNDCNIQEQNNRHRSPLEINACEQYKSDYQEAKRRYENSVDSAQTTWRKQ